MQALSGGGGRRYPSTGGLLLFAAGDFACNLYWQSSVFYLLFFYTDVLRLTPAVAGVIALVGSLWDGIADLGVGLFAQRSRWELRRLVAAGALPLGLSFIALYLCSAGNPVHVAMLALGAQLLFRTCYALVNVSYSAWSVRISSDSDDRATIAGARMIFGTAASLVLATVTQHLAQTETGRPTSAAGFLASAALFAVIGTIVLLVVARGSSGSAPVREPQEQATTARCLRALVRNKAFVTLNVAAMATAVASTLLFRSVLYYFSDVARSAAAGSATLAAMGLIGAAAVPFWMLVGRRRGTRAVWLASGVIALLVCLVFAIAGERSAVAAAIFLLAMQIALTGFNFAFWAMLPDTVDFGELQTGARVDAVAFGAAALLQKLALGVAAVLIGVIYQAIGYHEGGRADAWAQAGISWTMILGPALFVAISLPFMAASPLRRGTHAAVLAALERRRGGQPAASSNRAVTPAASADGATHS